jgi:hypothetical protein
MNRGIKYIALNLLTAKLFIFVNRLFVNNKDFSSQIKYKIILANKTTYNKEFELTKNLIYWSLIKSKQVTKSVLASKIYDIIRGVNIAIAIGIIITIITD